MMVNRIMNLAAHTLLTVCVTLGLARPALAMTPDQLKRLLDDPSAERVVVIDVRSRAKYLAGHIPGSLHIPLLGIDARSVPPFGRVVLVWDGIDREAAQRGLAAFNAKPAIEAELLAGGYPAWSAPTTRAEGVRGLSAATTPGVTYQEFLKLADDPDLVVVDLRGATRLAEADALTDLGVLLPDTRIVEPLGYERMDMGVQAQQKTREGLAVRTVPRWLKSQQLGEGALYVLVDNGDGRESEKVARRLAGRGLSRVFVLTGGERALKSRGEVKQVTRSDQAGGP